MIAAHVSPGERVTVCVYVFQCVCVCLFVCVCVCARAYTYHHHNGKLGPLKGCCLWMPRSRCLNYHALTQTSVHLPASTLIPLTKVGGGGGGGGGTGGSMLLTTAIHLQ